MTFISNKKGSLKQWAVQYDVIDMLDGDTTAPSAFDGTPNEEGVVVVTADNVGIIDPDLAGGRAARGDRQIVWLRIESPVPFPVGFAVWRVDATRDPVLQIQRISPASIVGDTIYTTTECIYIPQGQALQIFRGAPNPVGLPAHVSMGVRGSTSADDEARMMTMCCCQAGGGTGGGGDGGGVSPLQRNVESFSTQNYSTAGGDDGTYFGYGAYYFQPTPLTFMQQSNAIFNNDEGIISPAAIKLAIRAGAVTNMAIHTTFALGFTAQPFIEISVAAGPFVRTFLTAAPQAFAANTTTLVACSGGAFAAGDRIRVGINITTEVLVSDLFAEVEITSQG
jgi:hypothetical protein